MPNRLAAEKSPYLRQHAENPVDWFPWSAGEPENEATAREPLLGAAGEAMTQCVQYFYEAHDAEWGGFGGAPKFPRPSVFEFLLRLAARQGIDSEFGRELVQMASFTLRR